MESASYPLKSRIRWRRTTFQTRNSLGRNKTESKYCVHYTPRLSKFCLFSFLVFPMFILLFTVL